MRKGATVVVAEGISHSPKKDRAIITNPRVCMRLRPMRSMVHAARK